ncbi:hypothetical protein Tco_0329346 [Tanacetum coccineum]
MNLVATQQVALDNSLVAPEKRLKIEKCNARIAFSKPLREETYQVTLEALKLSPCYPAFVITVEVPYVPEFSTKTLLHHPQKKNWLHSFRNLAILGGVIRYLQFILIKCIGHEEHLLQSSIDFMYQAENREISSARKEHMPYPRFTKVIINHFISKDNTISMRNMINLHIIRDDSLLGTLKFVSKTQDYQQYGALIPDDMINQDIKDSNAYKTYYNFATGKVPPRNARKYNKVASPPRKLSLIKDAEPVKKAKIVKRPAKKSTTAPTSCFIVRDTPGVSVSKKKAPAKADRSKASGLGDGTDLESRVPNEQQRKTSGIDERIDDNDDDSKDDNDDNNDDVSKGDDDKADSDDDDSNEVHDSERTDSDNDDENPSFTLKDNNEEEHDEKYESDDDNENVFEEEDDDDLYKDVDTYEQVIEDAHVTLIASHKTNDSKQSSSVSSNFANQFLILEKAPPSDHEVASLMNIKMSHEVPSTQIPSPLTDPVTVIPDSSTIASTTVPPTISMISPLPQLTTPNHTPTTASTTTSIPALPDFSSLFSFDQRVSTLETELSQLKQADLSAQVLEYVKSQLPTMVDDLLSIRIRYATQTALQSYTQDLEKKAQEERNTITESLENVFLAKSSSQPQSTYKAATSLTEFELKKIQLDKLEKSNSYQAAEDHRNLYDALIKSYQLNKDLFDSYGKAYSLKRSHEDKDRYEDPPAGSDQELKKRQARMLNHQEDLSQKSLNQALPKAQSLSRNHLATEKPPLTFDELMSTPIEFSAYVMHNLKIDNLTQEILIKLTFNLLKGTCKSFMELEYHFEECYKAVTDQLDWNNPGGHEYLFDLSKPLPLIEAQGRQVVPADYFFNNDLEYLKGGSSSRKYTTSITKTKAAKYDNIEGIEDMVMTLWSPVKHDVFSRKRIIAVTHVKVIKWYGYGYLEEIIVRREDQTLHKFKEGDFLRLNLRDIEDLLLLLVQKKLSNLDKDPETFRSDISKLTPYTAYKNPQGINYQDKFKRNRLMRSDELYKFCDGRLTSVQRVLHDIANNLRMDCLPKKRWSNLDRKRSHIMIKAIDQQLFETRLMRNLEKFIGGREYGNDFRLLERTI